MPKFILLDFTCLQYEKLHKRGSAEESLFVELGESIHDFLLDHPSSLPQFLGALFPVMKGRGSDGRSWSHPNIYFISSTGMWTALHHILLVLRWPHPCPGFVLYPLMEKISSSSCSVGPAIIQIWPLFLFARHPQAIQIKIHEVGLKAWTMALWSILLRIKFFITPYRKRNMLNQPSTSQAVYAWWRSLVPNKSIISSY